STLLIANLGDCCLLLIRQGEVVFRTSEMQHAFNFPLQQVGTHSRDEPMKDAQRYDVGVGRGDIVILGSDGLMDNLYDEEILDTLAEFAPPSSNVFPTPPNSRPSSPGALPPFSPQKVSEALCRRARMVSEQTTATTPFMERAIEEGIDFVGGKKDGESLVVVFYLRISSMLFFCLSISVSSMSKRLMGFFSFLDRYLGPSWCYWR
ncbi:hypothetical protein BCR39DRAFT_474086, partial [Naematelia encephala]